MDNTSTTLDALERTAAWVQQVQSQVERMSNSPEDSDTNGEEMPIISEDDIKREPSDRDDNSLTDHHDEALKMSQTFPPYVTKVKEAVNYGHIDIKETVHEFKKALEKFGISQRFASSYIMENTSQGNLSFLLDKGKTKRWSEISPRGRIPYIRMRRWLDSPEEQKQTMEQLYKNNNFKRGIKINGVMVPKKDRREKFSIFQLLVLCRVFEEDNNPSLSTRALLADKLEAPLERITIWFQNQRARNFPAKKLIKESKLLKHAHDYKSASDRSSKMDYCMKPSNTPLQLSNGPPSTSCITPSPSLPLNASKPSATITQEQEAKIQSCVNSILGTSLIPNINATSTLTNPTQMHPLAFPLPLMNMPQSIKSEHTTATSSSANGQNFVPFFSYPPNIFTSAPSNVTASATEALNLMKSYQPITIKDEPCDPGP